MKKKKKNGKHIKRHQQTMSHGEGEDGSVCMWVDWLIYSIATKHDTLSNRWNHHHHHHRLIMGAKTTGNKFRKCAVSCRFTLDYPSCPPTFTHLTTHPQNRTYHWYYWNVHNIFTLHSWVDGGSGSHGQTLL